jgi:RNA polymerase sigma-70 factor (ECF subfamily)
MPLDQDINDATALFQRGEERGFVFFFNSLYKPLLYYAYRILNDKPAAEDIVEDSFIKIWERHSSFSHHQVIKTWLYTTVRNACINKLKQEEIKEKHKDIIAYQNRNAYQESPLRGIAISEIITQVHTAIGVLPKECKKIFEMLYIDGKSTRQIADELGLSISTVKNQKARGLGILRKRFPQLTVRTIIEAFNPSM